MGAVTPIMANGDLAAPWIIRRVFQRHADGCGIACVAMLAGISYGEACRSIFGETETDATSYEDLRWALHYHGVGLARRLTPFWEGWYTGLREPALLALNPGADGLWHWAVWDGPNRRILDPLRWPARKVVVVGYSLAERRARRGAAGIENRRAAAERPATASRP